MLRAMLRILLTVSLCAGAALLRPDSVHAQAYPNRPIKIVVPFPAGGPTDGMARIISDRLGTVLGQSIIIENRGGGAGGSVGAKVVASADPDGYTILLTPGGSLTTGPAVHKNLGYDPLKAFVPVGLVMETPQALSAALRVYVDFGLQNPDAYRIAFMAEGARLPGAMTPGGATPIEGREHTAPMTVAMVLLQAVCDAAPAQAQRRLEEFERSAAHRQLFVS